MTQVQSIKNQKYEINLLWRTNIDFSHSHKQKIQQNNSERTVKISI